MPISAARKQELRSKFAKFNKDGDKYLSFDEMKKLLRRGNPDLPESDLHVLYDGIDKNHDGRIDFDEFVDFIFSSTGEEREKDSGMRGPERFFYDESTYTGVHTHGGPSTIDSRPGLGDMRAGMHHGGTAMAVGHTRGHSERGHSPVGGASRSSMGHTGRHAPAPRTSSRDHGGGGRELRGPERFFYDKSSYTGVHTHGGPSTIDRRAGLGDMRPGMH
mmetsp:Transcript_76264/g.135088  ORF Transcript_76264/g.135088 Transcript_76264/m.135088 type:complete len:218 (-) Transcript_76264:31-684(-)